MPDFPKRENDIADLAKVMLGGYQNNPALFPSADVAGLAAAKTEFEARSEGYIMAAAHASAAAHAKAAALAALVQTMKGQLKASEVDTRADRDALKHIGWAPRALGRPTIAPGQPRGLHSVEEGPGTVTLAWKSPDPGSGGRVRAYAVERRKPLGTGLDGEWQQMGMALVAKVTLQGQPCGLPLEYRVVAVNHGGLSEPSNTATVVL